MCKLNSASHAIKNYIKTKLHILAVTEYLLHTDVSIYLVLSVWLPSAPACHPCTCLVFDLLVNVWIGACWPCLSFSLHPLLSPFTVTKMHVMSSSCEEKKRLPMKTWNRSDINHTHVVEAFIWHFSVTFTHSPLSLKNNLMEALMSLSWVQLRWHNILYVICCLLNIK